MATWKKLYPVGGGIDLYSCRLCGSIGDSRYCKNLFREANRDILDFVQQVHGDVLPRDKTLPQLVCRSCERKVKNAATVKKTIRGSYMSRRVKFKPFSMTFKAMYQEIQGPMV